MVKAKNRRFHRRQILRFGLATMVMGVTGGALPCLGMTDTNGRTVMLPYDKWQLQNNIVDLMALKQTLFGKGSLSGRTSAAQLGLVVFKAKPEAPSLINSLRLT